MNKSLISYLGTHRNPHRDEACAFWLVHTFGGARYELAQNIYWHFFDTDEEADAFAANEKRHGRHGLLIGIGNSELNEHRKHGREANCSATLLTARHLGVEKERALRKIIETVTRSDCEGGNAFDSQASMVQLLNRYGGMSEARVIERTFDEFSAMHCSAIEFNEMCPAEFAKRGRVENVVGLTVAFVCSDLISMAPWMRSFKKTAVTTVRRGGGHVSMFFCRDAEEKESGRAKRLLRAIAPVIIEAEARKLGRAPEEIAEAVQCTLEAIDEDKALYIPHLNKRWYLHGPGAMLLNGSESQPGRPVSRLTNDELRAAVHHGLASL